MLEIEKLYLIGVEFSKVSVEDREKLQKRERAIQIINLFKQRCLEILPIITCARFELVFFSDMNREEVISMKKIFEIDGDRVLFIKREEVIRHLIRLAAGIDSLIVGESHIMHQIKSAFSESISNGLSGKNISKIFHSVIHSAKRIRQETQISLGSPSIGDIILFILSKIFSDTVEKNCLIIGTGEISEEVLENISKRMKRITVVSRTPERAKEFANRFGVEYLSWENLPNKIKSFEVIISATSSERILIDRTILPKPKVPSVMIDLSVPRNIEPSFKNISGVFLYNIDDITEFSKKISKVKFDEYLKAQNISEDEINKLKKRITEESFYPLIVEIKERYEKIIYQRVMERLNVSNEEAKIFSESLARKLLNPTFEKIKELSRKNDLSFDEIISIKRFFTEEDE